MIQKSWLGEKGFRLKVERADEYSLNTSGCLTSATGVESWITEKRNVQKSRVRGMEMRKAVCNIGVWLRGEPGRQVGKDQGISEDANRPVFR